MTKNRPILIIDDDNAILDFVQWTLEGADYEAIVARDAREALELLSSMSPALVLLDWRMPEMTGREFAEAYRNRPGPHAPIILMTAGGNTQEKAAEIEAVDRISKPFDIDDLLAIVAKHAREGSN